MKDPKDKACGKGAGSDRGQKTVLRTVLIVSLMSMCLLAALEVAARVAILALHGKSTLGAAQRFRYLNYQPFVMFGPNWDVSLAAFRRSSVSSGKPACRILLLGGSTAAGFPVDILASAFKARFPSHDFKLINAGFGGYNARQELIAASIWGPDLKPDLVVTLDGANDLVHRLRMDTAGSFYLNSDYDFSLKHPFLSPFAHVLRHSQAFQGLKRLLARHQVGSVKQYYDAIPVYVSAQHSINVLAKGLSATRVMVLQPYIGFKKPQSAAEANFTWYQYRDPVTRDLYNRTHKKLAELAENDRVAYVDGRSVFDGHPETIFSDDVHFVGQRGYDILARAIVTKLNERGWKPPAP